MFLNVPIHSKETNNKYNSNFRFHFKVTKHFRFIREQ
jgi:hypothetical protein